MGIASLDDIVEAPSALPAGTARLDDIVSPVQAGTARLDDIVEPGASPGTHQPTARKPKTTTMEGVQWVADHQGIDLPAAIRQSEAQGYTITDKPASAVPTSTRRNDSMGGPTAAHPVAPAAGPASAFKEMATEPIIPFSKLAPDQPTSVAGGVAKGAAQFAEGMTTPANLALMALPFGEVGSVLGKVGQYLPRAVAGAFSLDMLHSAYQQYPEVKAAIDKGDWPGAASAITKAGLTAAMGVASGAHAVRGGAASAPTAEGAVKSVQAGVEALSGKAKLDDIAGPTEQGTAKLSDIQQAIQEPSRRVSGSVNMPLNNQGRQEMAALAQKTAGQITSIEHSPNDRAGESAQIVAQANPQAKATPAEGLKPWAMGAHEGQSIETEKDAIAARIRDTPDEAPPGGHDQSTAAGEPFNEAKDRTVEHLQDQLYNYQPGSKVLNIASGRTLRMVDSYLKNGAPDDGSIDTEAMAKEGDWHRTGDLFQVAPGGLKPAESAEQPGIYYARHGATDFNGKPENSVSKESLQPGVTPEAEPQKPLWEMSHDEPAIEAPRPPAVPPAVGRGTSIAVPGEQTRYPGRYAVRELADVQASHNPFSFQPNQAYEHTNDRDYSRTGNAARVVQQSAKGTFDPTYLTTDAPTAEHGTPIVDSRGNALGGNSRTMTLARVYERGDVDAKLYRDEIKAKPQQFGIDPGEVDRFQKPVLVRELAGDVDPQKAITDFNKAAAADLTPEERAVSDGRRLSQETVTKIATKLGDVGEESTLAQSLNGDNGADILNSLVKDGVLTEQEKGGYLDAKDNLTPEAKSRIAKALVGRLFDTPAEFRETTPELRGKLERVAPQILRVEGREGWALTDQTREAVALLQDARAHRMIPTDLAKQTGDRSYSPEAVRLAETLRDTSTRAAASFRRYANDEALSREGSQASFFKPPTREEAFGDAFAPKPRAASSVVMGSGLGALQEPYERFVEEDLKPAAKRIASGLVEAQDQALRLVAPQLRGDSAELMGLSLRQRMAQYARRADQALDRMREARNFFNKRSAAENFDFIDDIEHGLGRGQVPNPKNAELEPAARAMARALDQRRREVQALGEGQLENFYTFYFGHAFERPEAAQRFFETFFRNRSLEGPKSFLKRREFPTYKEAIAAGMKPISDNPVDLFLLKAREMDRYLLAHAVLRDAAENGIAKRLARTEEERGQMDLVPVDRTFKNEWLVPTKADLPPNFTRIVDPIGGGKWYAQDGAAQVLNNYLSPGLRARSGVARLLMGLNNVMNQSNLGLSAFHLKAEAVSSMAGRASLGFVKAIQGDPAGAAWRVISSPIAPFVDYFKGDKLMREWLKPGSEGAPIAAMMDNLMRGGVRAGQSAEYASNAIESMAKQWRRGNVVGAALRSPFAAIEYMAKPLMEHLIPRLKLGAAAEMAQHEMARLGPGATVEDVQRVMGRIGGHVDNRLGEMVYDNLFWNRSFKDVTQLMVRSVGWNLGDLREAASAGSALKQLATGKAPVDPHGLGFVMGYAFTAAWIGAIYTYLHTGHGPQELEDYFFPKRADGKRYVLAPYIRDAYQVARDPFGTAIHKTGPLVNTLAEMVTNKDYYDRPIRNLDDPFVKQLEQSAGFGLRQMAPFTLQESLGPQTKKSRAEAAQRSGSSELQAEHFLGVQPAPAALQPGYKPKKDKP